MIKAILLSHQVQKKASDKLQHPFMIQFSSVQFSRSVASDSLRPHQPQHARPPCPSSNSWSLLKLMSIELVMPSNYLILCHALLLLPSIFPNIRGFLNESALRIRWSKYQSFSFNTSPFIYLFIFGINIKYLFKSIVNNLSNYFFDEAKLFKNCNIRENNHHKGCNLKTSLKTQMGYCKKSQI